MATVPLREQSCPRWDRPERPRLTLQDYTPTPLTPSVHSKMRRRTSRPWENLLFATAAVAVFLFFLVNFALSLYHTAAVSYTSPLTTPAVLRVTVHSGDTLWTYAREYESPDAYILDRVDSIARANHLASDAPLVPGQRLLVPVTNPVKLAQLEQAHRIARR